MSGRASQRMSGVRNFAELTTLGVSVAIIAAIACALVYRAFQPHEPYLVIEARALADSVERAGDRYVVPVEVHNAGDRTATKVALEVSVTGASSTDAETAPAELHVVDLEYLGGRSRQRVYLYLDRPPGDSPIEARVVHYRLD